MDPQIIYHDRYHLVSYVCLGLAAILGWMEIGTKVLARGEEDWMRQLAIALSLLCAIELAYPLTMWSPHKDSTTLFVRERYPSLMGDISSGLVALKRPHGTDPDSIWGFVEKFTPTASTIATTSVVTYGYHRRLISLLPNTQDRIDLSAPPEELLEILGKLGVTFLHLAPSSSQNGFMEPYFEKALASVRRIGELSGVKLVYEKSLAPNIVDRLYYVGAPTKSDDVLRYVEGRVMAEIVEKFAASRSGPNQIVLTWIPSPFADIEIQMSANGQQFRNVGVAAKSTGRNELSDVDFNVNYVFRIRKKCGSAVSAWREVEVNVQRGRGR